MTEKKKWIKIIITSNPILVETVCDYLVGIHNMGVDVATEDEVPTGIITGFAEAETLEDTNASELVATVTQYVTEMAELFSVSAPSVSHEFFEEEDWGKKWKQHFKPFAIVPDLIIAPTWEEYEKQGNELVIEMDPGMAFGTGHHATTSLSLEFIKETIESKKCATVLDVGCGTGILAMGAALFGAEKCLGVDNCQDAVNAAQENIKHNDLSTKIDIEITAIENITKTYDLVVANIIHDVLASMADALTTATNSNGYLVLSGVLRENQADSIVSIFKEKGFSLIEKRERDEWAAVLLQKGE